MTRYGGTKALDAEIKIDFKDNTILMDYSTVTGVARYESNNAVFLSSEWKAKKITIRIKYMMIRFLLVASVMFFVQPLYVIYFTFLVNHGIIKSAKAQYDHQRLLQSFYTYLSGTVETSVTGKLLEKKIEFPIHNNLFFSYKLNGEYKEKINSISLVRRYVKTKRFGIFNEIRQRGWNLIFEFTEPPEYGSCVVESIE